MNLKQRERLDKVLRELNDIDQELQEELARAKQLPQARTLAIELGALAAAKAALETARPSTRKRPSGTSKRLHRTVPGRVATPRTLLWSTCALSSN